MVRSIHLQPGDLAPDFALPDDQGQVRHLHDFAGQSVVLFFFPRADTPGCTTEAQEFTARLAQFQAIQTVVIGISADPPRKLSRFREKRQIATLLLADEQGKTLNAYGVWGKKSMYGKTFEGIVRSTVLIDHERRITEIWRNVKVPQHAETVLMAARQSL